MTAQSLLNCVYTSQYARNRQLQDQRRSANYAAEAADSALLGDCGAVSAKESLLLWVESTRDGTETFGSCQSLNDNDRE